MMKNPYYWSGTLTSGEQTYVEYLIYYRRINSKNPAAREKLTS